MMSEKVGGAEGTKLDEDFKELERVLYNYMMTSINCVLIRNIFLNSVYALSVDINKCLSLYHQKADITSKTVVDVINKTSEYLQPNPATRTKLSMLNTVSKMRGQVNSPGYPQPEGLLGECMTKYGRDIGEDTNFGKNCERSTLV